MNFRPLILTLGLLPLPLLGYAQEIPGKPDVWKSAGTRKATPAEIQALINTPGTAIIDRTPCRSTPIPFGTGSPVDEAAAKLVEIGEPAINPVLPWLHDKEMWRRRLAVEILGRIGKRKVTPVLLARLKDEKEEKVQETLAWSLAMLRDPHAESTLVDLVQNGPYLTHWPSKLGLARLHSRRAIDTLLAELTLPADTSSQDYNVKSWEAKATVSALAEGGPVLFPTMLKFVTNSKTAPSAVALAIQSAVALGDKRLAPVLLRLLDHPDDGVRDAAVNNLMKWPDARTFPALVRVLHGPKGQAQRSAGIVLATTGTPEALDVLAKGADDSDDSLRHAASNACRYLKTPEAIPMLLHLLKEGRKDTPRDAAAALGNLKAKTAIPALNDALDSPNAELRSASAMALGVFDDTQAIEGLLKALEDSSKEVRLIALRELREKHDARIIPAFQRLVADADKDIKREADFGIKWQETAQP